MMFSGLCVVPSIDIIFTHGLQSMIFADDTQMYLVMRRSERSSWLSKLAHDRKVYCMISLKKEILKFQRVQNSPASRLVTKN